MPGLWLYVLLTVVLESNPSDPALLGVALRSCTEALADAQCTSFDAESEEPDFSARLTWRDELHARVEVERALGRGGRATLGVREIAFADADSPVERYRALGLVVASYVLARRPAAAAPNPPPPRPTGRVALDLALIGGPALDRGRYRVGGQLRAIVRPVRTLPALSLLVSARGSHRPGGPSLTWTGLSLGVAGSLTLLDALRAEGRLEWVGQRLFAKAIDADSGASDRGGRFRMGGQLGLELLYRASAHLSPFIGTDLALLRPRVRVLTAGREVGQERTLETTLLLGTRIAW